MKRKTISWRAVSLWTGGSLVALAVCVGIFAPYLTPSDPLLINLDIRLSPPSLHYPLGTDQMGRCVLSRLIMGTRTSLFYSMLALGAALSISVPLGLLAGFAGGRTDRFIMRTIDMLLAFPSLILSIAITGLLGPSLANLLLAFVLVWWAGYARIVRGIVMQIKEKDFIMAARSSGGSPTQIVLRHILPNAARPMLVLASLEIGTIMLSISGLSFLGLGSQPPTPEWGVMLNDSRPYMQTIPRLMLYPGLAIMTVTIGFNLLGEGLRKRDRIET
ncbi:nickel transporter permease [Cohnella lupini]|uniref:Peptide/nickel transport system permease protein n=1 Tax=Cohnella lupini TaxID=1294267 RepID=A0A3D9INQ4_9BACL|nr:nickel transporter permease [Cohnella lupini]RED63268.1 peptide/nickel transport system permease protein [Cohnella lupini]